MVINISKTKSPHENSGALSGGRQHAPGAWGSDGSVGGNASGRSAVARPRFDAPVSQSGYRWWYVDALSDDGQYGLTIIGFVGSVFSPYYKRARKNSKGNPEDHCALNVALYGGKRRWAMTERGAAHVLREENAFKIGPSSMSWDGDELVIEIKERCMPIPSALRGRVRLKPGHIYSSPVALDANCKHYWQAVAPDARVSVDFDNPKLSWSGSAYHDMNWGEEPLEQGFKNWTWLRAKTATGTQVLYDVERCDGSHFNFGRRFEDGHIIQRNVPPAYNLPRGLWGMARAANSDAIPKLISTLEDAPFYTRNHVEITLDGAPHKAFHESLSLDRFMSPVVQMMLPFRMPRRP